MQLYSSTIGKLITGMVLAVQGEALSSDYSDELTSDRTPPAFTLYESGKFAEASPKLRALAQRGNARAQLYLATLYRTGTGVEANEYEAANWYGKAARVGIAEAQFHLGLMYLEGIGLTEDSNEALEWISKAADQGFGDAIDVFQYMLDHDEVLSC